MEYVETFKDLTAVETKMTEVFDKKGKLDKQRKVVSDFFVYQMKNDAEVVRRNTASPVKSMESSAAREKRRPLHCSKSWRKKKAACRNLSGFANRI